MYVSIGGCPRKRLTVYAGLPPRLRPPASTPPNRAPPVNDATYDHDDTFDPSF
jgi:hypothetical protein